LPDRLISIFGPTAGGKTGIAIELAQLLRERGQNPVAVSADAFQLYEGIDVLTAKPGELERRQLEHRLVSMVPIEREFTVAEFADAAHSEIDSLLAEGRLPIVVGGTGLYLRAALTDLDLKPAAEPDLRAALERELAQLGAPGLHRRLPEPVASAVHPNDRKRIVRALELEQMGERVHPRSDQLWSEELRRPAALFGVVMDRDALGQRISERVRRMVEQGIASEVERALERGASRTARKAIGFAELEAQLRGQASLEQATERIERRQRRYAKRQLTWMRKLAAVELIDRSGISDREAAVAILRRLDSLPPS
jgi:tRNA dimethylallyltransferase